MTADFKTVMASQVDPQRTRGLPKQMLSKLENQPAETPARRQDPGHMPDWSWVTWALPQCQWLQRAEVSSSVSDAWLKFGNPVPPPACLLCFIWSIKEQYSACNCLLYMLPCDSAFVAGLFSRFWLSLLALQECWSNDKFSQHMAKRVSISRTRNMCWYRRRWLWVTLQILESRQK